jgi:NTP pyrophosphatase (non-canonical NTP hydrolase)
MLAPILSTEDPYAAATTFCQAGWKLESDTSRDRADARAEVSLAGSRIVLVRRPAQKSPEAESPSPEGFPPAPGVEFKVTVPPQELSGLFLLHRSAGLAVSDIIRQPSGERAFRAEIAGYDFVVTAGDPDPDLAMVSTDPRIVALADGRRQRDGEESLTTTAMLLAEGSGESLKKLRQHLGAQETRGTAYEVAEQLGDVVIAAAILARQLGISLDQVIETKLGSASWAS